MMGAPVQLPAIVTAFPSRYSFGQTVTLGLPDAEVRAAIRRQFVGFIKDDKIIRGDFHISQAGKNPRARQRVYADDGVITGLSNKGILMTGFVAADDAEG